MSKKIGLFSDIHGTNTLNAIVDTFKRTGVDSALFLGDAVYDTMSEITLQNSSIYQSFSDQLKEDTELRKAILEGAYSEKQLKTIAEKGICAKNVSKKASKSAYEKLKGAPLELKVLGGNWDYSEEIEEVFGEDYLNGKLTELKGIKIAGFSGGGSPTGMTFPSETLATSDPEERQYYNWQELLSKENIGANVFASHIPFIPPKGHREYDSELLLESVLKRKAAGLDVPEVYMWGHEHTTGKVEYNERLEAFVVSPGTGATNHSKNMAPTFMTAEFNDENKLTKVHKYEIRSSLEGLANVVLVEEFELDYENKKVNSKKKEDTIIAEADINKTKDHLNIDKNQKLIDEGFCFDYSDLSAEEKDIRLKNNVGIMFQYLKEKQNKVEEIVRKTALKHSNDFDIKEASDEVYQLLVKEAADEFNANLDHVKDEVTKKLFESILLNAAYGANSNDIYRSIRKDGIKDSGEFAGNAAMVSKVCSDEISRHLQQYVLFNDLQAKDYQDMAELYMPQGFERKNNAERDIAFNMWLKSYQHGLVTEEDMKEFREFYKQKEGYEKKPIEKEELLSMFNVKEKETIENKLEKQRMMQKQRQMPDEDTLRELLKRINPQQKEQIEPVYAENNV